jgi:FkbM family methyltransferase
VGRYVPFYSSRVHKKPRISLVINPKTVLTGLRILRMKKSYPAPAQLFKSWLRLQFFDTLNGSGSHSFKLAEVTVTSPTRKDIFELFWDIFLSQTYYVVLPPCPNIIDCGANIGCATLYFKFLAPDARITCFEPSPLAFPYLERNVKENRLQDVTLIQAACGKNNTPIVFHMDPDHSTGSTTKNIWRGELHDCEVQQVRLSDQLKETVDLLKLDVEGAEWDVIEDLTSTGRISLVQRMIIEFHHNLKPNHSKFAGFLEMLEGAGFAYTVTALCPQCDCFSSRWQPIMLYAWQADVNAPIATAPLSESAAELTGQASYNL